MNQDVVDSVIVKNTIPNYVPDVNVNRVHSPTENNIKSMP